MKKSTKSISIIICAIVFITLTHNTSALTPEFKPIVEAKPPTVTGGGTFIVSPVDGKCPANYLTSVDGGACVKFSPPTTDSKPVAGEIGTSPVVPINGKCPDGYLTSADGKQCEKPSSPRIFIAPRESTKEIIFEPKGGEVIFKEKNVERETRIAPREEIKTVLPVATESMVGGKPSQITRDVTIQPEKRSGKIFISTQGTSSFTKEPIAVKEGRIFFKQKELKVLPDAASETATKALQISDVKMELKDAGTPTVTKPVYEATGVKPVKIFGFIKTEMPVVTHVNAETGTVEKIKKPWWSLFAR